MNYEVIRHLRAMILDLRVGEQWSEFLPYVANIVNSQVHSSTGQAPKTLLYAGAIVPHRELIPEADQEPDEHIPATEYVRSIQATHELLTQLSRHHQDKVLADRAARHPAQATQFEPGSYVMLAPYNTRPRKLAASWAGPHRVLAQHGNVVEYEELVTGKTREVNLRRLRKFNLGPEVDPIEVAHRHDQGFSTVKQVNDHRYTNDNPPKLELFIEWLGWDLDRFWSVTSPGNRWTMSATCTSCRRIFWNTAWGESRGATGLCVYE